MTNKLTAQIALPALLLMTLFTASVQADDDYRLRIDKLPAYQQECASCHLAYPPALLPAKSWDRIMNNLENHFGTDASLDEATVIEISTWLQANAGGHKAARREPAEDRITNSRWFKHEHDDIRDEVWLRPSIKSPANCAACHTSAEQGEFDDNYVRIPR